MNLKTHKIASKLIYSLLVGGFLCLSQTNINAQNTFEDCEAVQDFLMAEYPCLSEEGAEFGIDCANDDFFLTFNEESLSEFLISIFGGDPCNLDEPEPWEPEPWEPNVEEEYDFLASIFPDCLAGTNASDFATIDDLYIFLEENCEGEEPEPWEPNIEEEYDFLASIFPDCLAGTNASDFVTIDDLYVFLEENCEGEEPEPWEPTLEEEFGYLQSCFTECLADYTVSDFDNIEDLYMFIEENCENEYPEPWEPNVEEEYDFLVSIFPDCLGETSVEDFASIEDLYIFLEENCEDEESEPWEPNVEEEYDFLVSIFPDCLGETSVEDFANIEDLYIFIEENCEGEEVDVEEEDTEGANNDFGFDLPEDISDYVNVNYPENIIENFLESTNDFFSGGFSLDNGIELWADENGEVTTITNLTSENLPGTIEDYLIENDFFDSIVDISTSIFDGINIPEIIILIDLGGGKSGNMLELTFDLQGNLKGSETILAEATGIQDFINLNINVAPNPTSDFLNIRSEEQMTNIILVNNLGQIVLENSPESNNSRIELSNVATGIYSVIIQTESGKSLKRVVIQ